MPISSSDIANLLASQSSALLAQQQIAISVANRYGSEMPTPPWAQQNAHGESIAGMGGALGTAASKVPDAVLGLGGAAAMFSMAPRYLDPFTSVAGAATLGYRAGGVGSAIGAALPWAGVYMAGGAALNWASNQMASGAQMQSSVMGGMSSMLPSANMGQLGAVADQMRSMHSQGVGSIPELMGLAQQGAQMGDLRTNNIGQFQQGFTKLVSEVRQVATTLNTSLNEAYEAIQAVKNIGVPGASAGRVLGTMAGLGHASGMSPGEMMQAAAGGAQVGRMAGIDPMVAINGAMSNSALFGFSKRNNLGADPQMLGQFQGAAYGFFGSRYGRNTLAAMMTPTGDFNEDVASQIASGTMSRQEINTLGQKNLVGNRDKFGAVSSELAATFISQYGPQGIAPALYAMTEGAANPETLRAQITGLSRRDQATMLSMGRGSAGLNGQMLDEAAGAFRTEGQSLGPVEAIKRSVDQLLNPLAKALSDVGAYVTTRTSSMIEGASAAFVAGPHARDTTMQGMRQQAGLAGNMAAMGRIDTMSAAFSTTPTLQGWQSAGDGFFASGLPRAFQAQREGVNPLEMPGFGLSSTDGVTAGEVASHAGVYGAGRLAMMQTGHMGALGPALSDMALGAPGRALMAGVKGSGGALGWMGLGGLGLRTGTAAMGGLAMRMGGWALSGASRLAGPVGAALLASDVATQVAGQGLSAFSMGSGVGGTQSDAIVGKDAELLRLLDSAGVSSLEDPRETGRAASGVQVGGTLTEKNHMGKFVTDRNMRDAQRFLGNAAEAATRADVKIAQLPHGGARMLKAVRGNYKDNNAKLTLLMDGAGLTKTEAASWMSQNLGIFGGKLFDGTGAVDAAERDTTVALGAMDSGAQKDALLMARERGVANLYVEADGQGLKGTAMARHIRQGLEASGMDGGNGNLARLAADYAASGSAASMAYLGGSGGARMALGDHEQEKERKDRDHADLPQAKIDLRRALAAAGVDSRAYEGMLDAHTASGDLGTALPAILRKAATDHGMTAQDEAMVAHKLSMSKSSTLARGSQALGTLGMLTADFDSAKGNSRKRLEHLVGAVPGSLGLDAESRKYLTGNGGMLNENVRDRTEMAVKQMLINQGADERSANSIAGRMAQEAIQASTGPKGDKAALARFAEVASGIKYSTRPAPKGGDLDAKTTELLKSFERVTTWVTAHTPK